MTINFTSCGATATATLHAWMNANFAGPSRPWMESTSWGTVERHDEWLGLAESVLSRRFERIRLHAVRLNAQPAARTRSQAEIYHYLVADLGESLVQELLARNESDMRLHQVAEALLSRRLAEEGREISLRRAYDEAQEMRGSRRNRLVSRT